LVAQVRVSANGLGGPNQAIMPTVITVFMCSVVEIRRGNAEVDQVKLVAEFPTARHKVMRFDVPMDDPTLVNPLNDAEHLIGNYEDRLERKLLPRTPEKYFKGRTHVIHDKKSATAIFMDSIHFRNAIHPVKPLVHFVFVIELRALRIGFDFDRNNFL
jgi:hypothetical protein